eukprot:Rmarinus@m.7735
MKKREFKVYSYEDIAPSSELEPVVSTVRTKSKEGRKKKGDDKVFVDLEATVKELDRFAASHLIGNDRFKWEKTALQKLGGMPEKNVSVPLKALQGMRRKAIERQKSESQRLRESGVVTAGHSSSKAHTARGPNLPIFKYSRSGAVDRPEHLKKMAGDRRGDRRILDGERGIKASVGTFKDGTLRISASDVRPTAPAKQSGRRPSEGKRGPRAKGKGKAKQTKRRKTSGTKSR